MLGVGLEQIADASATQKTKKVRNSCLMCVFFCPTGALTKVEQEDKAGIAFRVSYCANCRLCEEICYLGAVGLFPAVHLNNIIDNSVDTSLMRDANQTPWMDSEER